MRHTLLLKDYACSDIDYDINWIMHTPTALTRPIDQIYSHSAAEQQSQLDAQTSENTPLPKRRKLDGRARVGWHGVANLLWLVFGLNQPQMNPELRVCLSK